LAPTTVREQEDNDMAVDEGALQALLDREAIRDLVLRHSDAATRGDYGALLPLYVPDAVWDSPQLGMHFEATRDLVTFLEEAGAAMELLVQTASNTVVDLIGPDRARATSTVKERVLGTGPDPINLEQDGMYYDELVRTDDGWRFTKRTFVTVHVSPGVVTGDLLSSRPLPRPE
jgi:hypothetical protein